MHARTLLLSVSVLTPGCLTPPQAAPVSVTPPPAAPASPPSPTPAAPPSMKLAQPIPYNWKSVQILGGGFVTGIVFHPTEPDLVYARTDIGGAYRYSNEDKAWIPLLDMLGRDEIHYCGVERSKPRTGWATSTSIPSTRNAPCSSPAPASLPRKT